MHNAIPLILAALVAVGIVVKDASLSLSSHHTIVSTCQNEAVGG